MSEVGEAPAAPSWRDDPTWRLTWYAADHWGDGELPDQPTEATELANPPLWASLYDGGRIVATWYRPAATSDDSATVPAE